jgi:hypothetical protein
MPSLTYGFGLGTQQDPLRVRLVLGEEDGNISCAIKIELAQVGMFHRDGSVGREPIESPQQRALCIS